MRREQLLIQTLKSKLNETTPLDSARHVPPNFPTTLGPPLSDSNSVRTQLKSSEPSERKSARL